MGDVSKGEGRTILFVSHNMGAILNLCNTGMLLNHGRLHSLGEISHVLADYNNLLNTGNNIEGVFNGNLVDRLEFDTISINGQKNSNVLAADKVIDIEVEGKAKTSFKRVIFIISLYCNGVRLFTLRESATGREVAGGNFKVNFNLSAGALRPGNYTLALGAWGDKDDDWIWGTEMYMLTIAETWTEAMRKTDEGIFNGEFLRSNG